MSILKDAKRETERKETEKMNGGEKPPTGSFVIGGTLYKPAQNDDWF